MLNPKEKRWVLWEAWRARKLDSRAIADLQHARLTDMLGFARANSSFYHGLYTNLPDHINDLSQVPHVTKQQLMSNFNKVVTDKEITKNEVDAFATNLSNVGKLFLDKYLVCSTSGTSGHPGVFFV